MCWRSVRPPADRRCAFPAPPPFSQVPATFRRYNPAFQNTRPSASRCPQRARNDPFPCQCCVRLDGGVVDELEHCVGEGKVLIALPVDAALCQHVVVAADAQADAAVLLIGKPRVFQRVEVEVDHIIQCADGRFHRAFHIGLVLHRQITEETDSPDCRPQTHLGVWPSPLLCRRSPCAPQC